VSSTFALGSKESFLQINRKKKKKRGAHERGVEAEISFVRGKRESEKCATRKTAAVYWAAAAEGKGGLPYLRRGEGKKRGKDFAETAGVAKLGGRESALRRHSPLRKKRKEKKKRGGAADEALPRQKKG